MEQISTGKKVILGMQHVLAMFGATVLVPMLTGLNPGIAILAAGIGTLVFHSVTKGIVPVFLGSSFAFISAISLVLSQYGIGVVKTGIIATGFVYIMMAGIIKLVGVEKVKSFFPPIVVGPMIMVIGLRLSPTAINMLRIDSTPENLLANLPAGIPEDLPIEVIQNMGIVLPLDMQKVFVALLVVCIVIAISIWAKGFFKMIPILIAVVMGYVVCLVMGMIDVTPIMEASWIGFSEEAFSQIMTLPAFNQDALVGILAIAPIALVVFIEHIGDITTNGAVVGKDFFKNPGIHRTLLGDGLATVAAGLLGGPANTTYGENTGVLAVTKVYDPKIIRIAALFAVGLSLCGKFTALVNTIPGAVMGGISIVLFGMIAAVGVRTLVEEQLDFKHSRNLLIAAVIFVVGIGVSDVPMWGNITISGLAIAALFGVILNKFLPQNL
ncbi:MULTISPECIES: uracil-xanthine permease family protein [Zhenhengia]|uniref:uracil-xanthine permease family protein n=1 Tax=Zhenhengia TaxID=2944196 RepID=UPI0015AF358F|nr:solute carrier family 23 protein [Zhenhengia yiwuensis]MDU6359704.1 uracil-xanthine permease family protein [Clostridiales bacterium]MDY3366852.1 uracil-xanthine permease family protein [Zhenhengia yiwuensis]